MKPMAVDRDERPMPTPEEVEARLASAKGAFVRATEGPIGEANASKWRVQTAQSGDVWQSRFLDVFQKQLEAAEESQGEFSFDRQVAYSTKLRDKMKRRGGAPAAKPAARSPAAGEQPQR